MRPEAPLTRAELVLLGICSAYLLLGVLFTLLVRSARTPGTALDFAATALVWGVPLAGFCYYRAARHQVIKDSARRKADRAGHRG